MATACPKVVDNIPDEFSYRPDLATAATPRDLQSAPRHRWFYFPHSYSYRLVDEVLDYWGLQEGEVLADNFVGSGTTLLVARERGIPAIGYDLSPLAVTVSNAKIGAYRPKQLRSSLSRVLADDDDVTIRTTPSDRLDRAFTKLELQEFQRLTTAIDNLPRRTRIFFQTAILSMVPQFSRAVADGGWFRWKEWPDQSQLVKSKFEEVAELMIADAESLAWQKQSPSLGARLADARKLPLAEQSIDAIISSPPYANRHDYSRIFQIDLLLLGKSEGAVTRLRRHSLRSHVEARRPPGYSRRLRTYAEPKALTDVLDELPKDADLRIARLLKGYFEDLFLSLQELHRVLRPGGKIAYVIGNVRHAGTMVPVDEIMVQLAGGAGLVLDCAWVMRQRGNSAQQMGKFGREGSRETVVLLTKVDNG